MTRPNIGARVNAVQGDGNTRCVEITLLSGGESWEPPEGVQAAIAYYQPNGHKGLYDKLADDSDAISISGNVATIILAHQMLTASGTVQATLVFHDAQLNRLTTFPFSVSVARNPVVGAQKTEDYIRLQWLVDKLKAEILGNTESVEDIEPEVIKTEITDFTSGYINTAGGFGTSTLSKYSTPIPVEKDRVYILEVDYWVEGDSTPRGIALYSEESALSDSCVSVFEYPLKSKFVQVCPTVDGYIRACVHKNVSRLTVSTGLDQVSSATQIVGELSQFAAVAQTESGYVSSTLSKTNTDCVYIEAGETVCVRINIRNGYSLDRVLAIYSVNSYEDYNKRIYNLVHNSLSNIITFVSPVSGYLFVTAEQSATSVTVYKKPANAGNSASAQNKLSQKRILVLGDSMVFGHTLNETQTWLYKLSARNAMSAVNAGTNGAYLSKHQFTGQDNSVYDKVCNEASAFYVEDISTYDYILIFAGTNDTYGNITLGAETSESPEEFYGAINCILDKLQSVCVSTKIGVITPYVYKGRKENCKTYINALVKACNNHCIPVFDNSLYGGINWNNDAQTANLSLGDNCHLNENGQDFASRKYESFLMSI